MKGFINFIREQGVVGLAVGFILGGAVSQLVNSFVNDIINPLLGLVLGKLNLSGYVLQIHSARITWGAFLTVFINFIVVALVVYFGVKWLRLDRLNKK